MMVRLDKILHMITRFKAEFKGLEQNQYAQPPHGIKISNKSFIVFKRMGVIGRDKTLTSIEKEIITSIPYGREEFLFLYLDKLSEEHCRDKSPYCKSCTLKDHCDYNNAKNDWMVN